LSVVILHADAISRAMTRIAHEIVEHNPKVENLFIVGLQTRGVFLAERLAKKIKEITQHEVPTATLDITFHRDDLNIRPDIPVPKSTNIETSLDGKQVILVDDVIFHGRSIRAGLDALGDHGRPTTIQLAVLVDRGHRELPIRPDYVGKNVPTSLRENVVVHLKEADGKDEVLIEKVKET
jgi:pyrimidine operon attenuation protein / uracil phosphoribosyltransferase